MFWHVYNVDNAILHTWRYLQPADFFLLSIFIGHYSSSESTQHEPYVVQKIALMTVFWVVTLCGFVVMNFSEKCIVSIFNLWSCRWLSRGDTFLRKVGKHLQGCTPSQLERPHQYPHHRESLESQNEWKGMRQERVSKERNALIVVQQTSRMQPSGPAIETLTEGTTCDLQFYSCE
jgi:hypothetical protein